MQFPDGDVGLGFSSMVPWLTELSHTNPTSLRRLSKVIPALEAKVVHLVPTTTPLDCGSSESDAEGEKDDMDVSATPTKPRATTSNQDEGVVWILQDPGVSRIPIAEFVVSH